MRTTAVLEHSSELNAELRDLASRDLQLWSIGALVLTVMALGFMSLIAPNMMRNSVPLKLETRYLPQLFAGLLILIVLFNMYLLDQKRRLSSMRENLVRRMLLTGCGDQSGPRDTLTDTFLRDSADHAIAREQNRLKPFALVMVDIADFRRINQRFGNLAGDHLLVVASQIIRSATRGSDIVCRYGGDEFLVILPQTSLEQAKPPIARMHAAVEEWNRTANLGYTLGLRIGVAAGPIAGAATAVLAELTEHTRGGLRGSANRLMASTGLQKA